MPPLMHNPSFSRSEPVFVTPVSPLVISINPANIQTEAAINIKTRASTFRKLEILWLGCFVINWKIFVQKYVKIGIL